MIIGAERLAGVHSYSRKQHAGDVEAEFSGTMVNLLWGSARAGTGDTNPYAIPYLSAHGVLPGGVTLGGSLGYISSTGEAELTVEDPFDGGTINDKRDLPKVTAFAIAPRVGFILPTSDAVSLWFRGGVTYYNITAVVEEYEPSWERRITESGVALSLDPMLVLTPIPHVGILLGPVLDFGVSGELEVDDGGSASPAQDPEPSDVKFSNYGVAAGIAIFL